MTINRIEIRKLNISTTSHSYDRMKRVALAMKLMAEDRAYVVAMFSVDKGHRNGNEIHIVYSNGMIVIVNEQTERLITVLFGRSKQIERYFIATNTTVSINVLKMGIRNEKMGYNKI